MGGRRGVRMRESLLLLPFKVSGTVAGKKWRQCSEVDVGCSRQKEDRKGRLETNKSRKIDSVVGRQKPQEWCAHKNASGLTELYFPRFSSITESHVASDLLNGFSSRSSPVLTSGASLPIKL